MSTDSTFNMIRFFLSFFFLRVLQIDINSFKINFNYIRFSIIPIIEL